MIFITKTVGEEGKSQLCNTLRQANYTVNIDDLSWFKRLCTATRVFADEALMNTGFDHVLVEDASADGLYGSILESF